MDFITPIIVRISTFISILLSRAKSLFGINFNTIIMVIYIHKVRETKKPLKSINKGCDQAQSHQARKETKMKNINVNPITETIEVSKAFLKKASVYGSSEYFALKEVRSSEPTFTVKEITIKKNASKKTYGSLTFEAMIAHIKLVETDEEEKEKVLDELKEIRAYSKSRGSSYPIVKKWFLNKYKESYDNFLKDTEEIKENETKAA